MNIKNHFYRDTWAEINIDAIQENITQLKGILPKEVQVMAAVKANGYGHGAVDVAYGALDAGATYLGVAILDEALVLRDAGIDAPILVLGYVRPENVTIAAEKNIAVTIFQEEWVKEAANFLKNDKSKVTCHVKLDTGMGRIGIRTEEEGYALIDTLKKYPNFEVEGIYTHYATADELETSYLKAQQRQFKAMIDSFEAKWSSSIPLKHCGNSATALRFGDQCYNMVRFGISMYGLAPSEEIKDILPFRLKEAFSLHSRITHVKELHEGCGISYGAEYKTTEGEWIGTVPIGYADGWIRMNRPGDVLVNGERAPIVGRICMDQMMISLKKKVPIGTKVTLIGKQKEEYIPVDEVANRLQTINYEIPCVISYRVPRVIIKNNQPVRVKNKVFVKE
ncbi:alanine racemase [Evansella sp. AB-P1]|uniref:alanine racemase n=1 Tax=Evansella sp. AB-P1 TaxID=3037653 RepID=UPI00241F1E1F|nr:alanine racemase [Evansella sp. AB-P1]MDG5787944.1 alanine racemase [Evansella sp. AB-P1]